MPLFNGNFESVFTQPVNSSNELTQRAVTLLIEAAIVEKLVECFLFASLKHALEGEEHDFADEELVVVSVMTGHGRLFNGNFGDAVVVSAIQMLKLYVQFVPLVLQLLDDLMHVVDLSVVHDTIPFQRGNLLLELADLLLGQVLLLLNRLAKRQFLVQIVL